MPEVEKSNLELGFREEGKAVVVSFKGVLDVFSIQKIKDKVDSKLSGTSCAVFDMNGLSYIDSAGIGFVIGTLKHMKTRDKQAKLIISGLNDYLKGIFGLISFERIIPVAPGVSEALKEFGD